MVNSRDAARTAVGIIGNVIACMLFLSPVPTFVQIWKKGSVERFSPTPYVATLANCGIWVLYGLPMVKTNSLLVLTINGFGFVIELVYLFLFLRFSTDWKKRLKILMAIVIECIFLAVLSVLVLTAVHNRNIRATIVGIIAALGNVGMYASPLMVMKMVIKTKSVEYMPLFLSLTATSNGICWTLYALIRFDPYIAAPNGLGTLFGLAQLILYATFYRSTKRQIQERQANGEMGLAEITTSEPDSKKLSGVA